MSDPDACPICLVEYTTNEIHKPASLKCGHLFGNSCLKRWFNDARSALCPTCAKPSRKTDIRVLFATSVRTSDSEKEKEILQKYLNEKNASDTIKLENSHLKTSIEYLQNEIRKLEEKIKSNEFTNKTNLCGENVIQEAYKRFKFTRKLRSKNLNSILLFDRTNPTLFITSKDKKSHGYKKVDYNCEGFEYIPHFDKEEDSFFICDMKMSSFNDGLILIGYGKRIKLINSISGNELLCITIENKCRCVSFDNKDRNIVYIGDDSSNIIVYDLRLLKIIRYIKLEKGIHAMAKIENFLYVGCVFKWFRIYTNDNKHLGEELEIDENLMCTNLISDNEKMLVTFRDNKMKTIHFLYSKCISSNNKKINNEMNMTNEYREDVVELNEDDDLQIQNTFMINSIILSRALQFRKSRDKIAEDGIYICNEIGNKIEAYAFDSFRIIETYRFNENIVDFIVYKKKMYVLTDNFVVFLER